MASMDELFDPASRREAQLKASKGKYDENALRAAGGGGGIYNGPTELASGKMGTGVLGQGPIGFRGVQASNISLDGNRTGLRGASTTDFGPVMQNPSMAPGAPGYTAPQPEPQNFGNVMQVGEFQPAGVQRAPWQAFTHAINQPVGIPDQSPSLPIGGAPPVVQPPPPVVQSPPGPTSPLSNIVDHANQRSIFNQIDPKTGNLTPQSPRQAAPAAPAQPSWFDRLFKRKESPMRTASLTSGVRG